MWVLKFLFAFWLLVCTFDKIVALETFRACNNGSTYCENDGICFIKNDKEYCSCMKDYHGEKCDKHDDDVFKKVVFGLGILCAIFLIVLFVLAWQLHTKTSEYEDYKEKIKYEKREAEKQKNNLKAPRSRRGSSSSAGSNRDSAASVNLNPNGFLFDITATGIERSTSYQEEMQMPQRSVDQDDGPDKAVPATDIDVERLSKVGEIPRIASVADDNASLSSVSIGSTHALMPNGQYVPGRPKSWAGPASEVQENLNKIYDEYYRGKSDDEAPVGNEVQIDNRGYVKASRSSPRPGEDNVKSSHLKVDNLRKFNQYTDSKGRPRSMTDLRMLALTSEVPKKAKSESNFNVRPPVKVRSVENIHTGRLTVLTPHPKHNQHQNKNQRVYGQTSKKEGMKVRFRSSLGTYDHGIIL